MEMNKENTIWLIETCIQKYHNKEYSPDECFKHIEGFVEMSKKLEEIKKLEE